MPTATSTPSSRRRSDLNSDFHPLRHARIDAGAERAVRRTAMAVSRRAGRPRTAAKEPTKGPFPMRKRASKFALMSIVGGVVLMFAAITPAHAQAARSGGAGDHASPAAGAAAEHGTGLTTDGARKLGAGLG